MEWIFEIKNFRLENRIKINLEDHRGATVPQIIFLLKLLIILDFFKI